MKNYLRALWLWARIWDICWWHNSDPDYSYYCNCLTAWEVAQGIWLEKYNETSL